MAKKYKYSFAGKKGAREGKGAVLLSAVALALFFISLIISFMTEGNAGILVGAFGLFSILCAGYGFYLGMYVLRTRRNGNRLAMIGSIAAGIVGILWLSMFLLGLK